MRYLKIPLSVVLFAGILLAGMAFAKADHFPDELVEGMEIPVSFVCRSPQPVIMAAAALPIDVREAEKALQRGVAMGECLFMSEADVGLLGQVQDSGVDADGDLFYVVIVVSPYNKQGFFTIIFPESHPLRPDQEDS